MSATKGEALALDRLRGLLDPLLRAAGDGDPGALAGERRRDPLADPRLAPITSATRPASPEIHAYQQRSNGFTPIK